MDHQKALITGLYDRCAPLYDQVGPKIASHLGQRVVELMQLRPGAAVLDVGTGRGACLFPAAEVVGASGRVVGIDLSKTMVEGTTAEVRQRQLHHVELYQMDAEHLAFVDASFDSILCGYAIFWFPHLEQALSEFYRVLRPGGTVAITMSVGSDERWQWYNDLLALYNNTYGLFVDYGLSGINQNVDGLTSALTATGFQDIQTNTESLEFFFANADEWWAAQWSHGARSPLEQMSPDVLTRFQAEVFAVLVQMQTPNGYPMSWPTSFTIATKAYSL